MDAGLFAEGTELSASGPAATMGVPAWDDLDDESKALYARHMEVYAAAVDGVDQSLARIVDRLRELGEYDNTIFVFTSDNGGAGESGVAGTRSYFSRFVQIAGLPDDWEPDVPRPLSEMGGPRVHGQYPRGWAHVSNTPFRMYKGTVFEGGVHTPLILTWPAGLRRDSLDDGIRRSFAFITDIAPTLFDLAGIERPLKLRGVATEPMDGETGWRLMDSGELLHVGKDLTITRTRPFPHAPRHLLTLADLDPTAAASQAPAAQKTVGRSQ